jgi:hypothetical protein
MHTGLALKSPEFFHQLVIAPFYANRFAVDNRIGNGFSGLLDNSPEGGSRNTHLTARFFVTQTFQVRQPDRLSLINSKADLLQIKHRDSPWFEVVDFWIEPD